MASKVKKTNKIVKNNKKSSCKVCNHEHLIEIDTWLSIDDLPSREVSERISNRGWEPISYVTLLSHKKEHINQRRHLMLMYIADKQKQQNDALNTDELPTENEFQIRLAEVKRIDSVISQSHILAVQSAKVLREQLNTRIEQAHKTAAGKEKKMTDSKGHEIKERPQYVPIQKDLVHLFKVASEELRMSQKTKFDILGIDSDARQADAAGTLVELVMQKKAEEEQEEKLIDDVNKGVSNIKED